ncbi:zona pellucida domain-containing protein, partial [Pseudoalteromonas sp. SCQQ13]|uniref:zona pellucida domain-containing protein n=1 Tax=Pseudoalteromonas sp. SCQQ13 TaxID=2792066 RepID=UPI001E2E3B2C
MEDSGYVVYENRMSSSYEVGIGPLGSITRDSHFELLFQCRYSGTSVEALVVEVNTVPPPPPVAAPGPLRVELRLANGQCVTKGCAEGDEAYTSYYSDADYPITKVLREPVYVEVHIVERTDPNIVLMLGHCWATSAPNPLSLPQWDLLVDGCPYQDDRYLTTLVPVTGSSGLQFPTHYKRFIVKMFTFVDPTSLAPLQETIFIHCSTAVCHPSSGSCEQSCGRTRRDTHVKNISS